MKYTTGEKINTVYGPGTIISVNEKSGAYLVRWSNGSATWLLEHDLAVANCKDGT